MSLTRKSSLCYTKHSVYFYCLDSFSYLSIQEVYVGFDFVCFFLGSFLGFLSGLNLGVQLFFFSFKNKWDLKVSTVWYFQYVWIHRKVIFKSVKLPQRRGLYFFSYPACLLGLLGWLGPACSVLCAVARCKERGGKRMKDLATVWLHSRERLEKGR